MWRTGEGHFFKLKFSFESLGFGALVRNIIIRRCSSSNRRDRNLSNRRGNNLRIRRSSVLHHLGDSEREVFKRRTLEFRIGFNVGSDFVAAPKLFAGRSEVVSIHLRVVFAEDKAPLETLGGFGETRLVDDPGSRGVVVEIRRVFARDLFLVAGEWVVDHSTSDVLVLLLAINNSPLVTVLALCCIGIDQPPWSNVFLTIYTNT